MDYEQFITAIQDAVAELLPETCIQTQKIIKNNAVHLMGLSFREEGESVAPVIYLEEYYELFQNGMSLQSLARQIVRSYKEQEVPRFWGKDLLTDFESIKDRIVFKLINTKRNRELLKKIPSLPVYDLSLVFVVLLPEKGDHRCSALIRNSCLEIWKIPFTVLYEYAKKNTPRLCPPRFYSMEDILGNCSQGQSAEDLPIYVLTNQEGANGAAVILYEGILKKVYEELKESFYLIPSSIHEFLVLPESFAEGEDYLRHMVFSINRTELQKEEVLSDEIYYFNGEIMSQC